MLPQNADKIRLIIGLNRLGNEFDIQPQGIRFSQTDTSTDTSAAESAISTQTIEFTVEDATYSEFTDFVQKIQQAERIMDIQKVSMQRQNVVSQTDEGSGLSYQVEINAYQMQTM
jgi:Tfp pilus assembly protein PilO